MKNRLFCGIDTSNYTTSLAIVDGEGKVLCNRKQLLPVPSGACGLRQSDALFAHTKALPAMLEEISPLLAEGELSAVGVSVCPRRQEGSYMPCFLAGQAAAQAMATGAGVPLFSFSHQCGHLMAAVCSAGAFDLLSRPSFLAFHVSGGTTEMLLAHYDGHGFACEVVGGTADISAGQLIDRAGVLMGLQFPCGAQMEQLACANTRKLPRMRYTCREGHVNLSGFENKLKEAYEQTRDAAYVSALAMHTVAGALASMLSYGFAQYGTMPVLFSGGVMSCAYLKERMGTLCEGHFAPPQYSSDNAAGIAWLARAACLKGEN